MDVESATASPRTAVSARIQARSHTIVQDKPPELGGNDEGPMASELLLAGLLACQLSTFAKVAAKRRLTSVRAESVEGDLHFEGGDIAAVSLRWSLAADVEDAQLETLLRLTESACTVSKALRVPVSFTFRRV